MKELNASTAGGSTQFILGLSQVIMTVLACPTMSIIKYSPITTHFEDDSVKTKAERTNLGGAWATVGMNPTLRVGGTSSSLSGNEQTQKRWQVTTHFLDSGGGIMSECKDGMLWKYAYNDKVFQPISAQDFHDASPTAVFGLSRASRLPQLEVDVVTHWTMSVVPLSRIFSLFRKGTKKTLPAYRNFFHHVSVGVDLGKVKHEKSWVVGAKTRDKQTSPDMMQFDPIAAMVESSESIDSACEITLRRAIYGRIEPLTTEDKTGKSIYLVFHETMVIKYLPMQERSHCYARLRGADLLHHLQEVYQRLHLHPRFHRRRRHNHLIFSFHRHLSKALSRGLGHITIRKSKPCHDLLESICIVYLTAKLKCVDYQRVDSVLVICDDFKTMSAVSNS